MRLETNLSKRGQKVRNRGLFWNGVPPSAPAKNPLGRQSRFLFGHSAQHIYIYTPRAQRRERVSEHTERARVSKQWRIHFYIINSLMLISTTTAKMLPRRTSLWVNLWVHNLNCRSSYHLQDVFLHAIYIYNTYVIPCARQRRASERAHIIANNSAHCADFTRYQFSFQER